MVMTAGAAGGAGADVVVEQGMQARWCDPGRSGAGRVRLVSLRSRRAVVVRRARVK